MNQSFPAENQRNISVTDKGRILIFLHKKTALWHNVRMLSMKILHNMK
jgi:hypothetical protein